MKTKLFFTILFAVIGLNTSAQYQKPLHKGGDTTGVKSKPLKTEPSGTVVPSKVIDKGTINPVHHNEEREGKSKNDEKQNKALFEKKLKNKDNINKTDSTASQKKNDTSEDRLLQVAPTVISSWYAGQMTNFSPPDNSMAIANNGNIVVADNEHIYFYNAGGVLLGSYTYNSFFSVSEGFTDPHVLYDSGADRFIFVIQCGATAVEKLRVCFSYSNNPYYDGFHVYSYDVKGLTGYTVDYPNIAVSTDELFVTGNLNGGTTSNILYQIDKYQGYSGSSINSIYYKDIEDGCKCGVKARALFPVTWGQQGNYGPGIYLIAAEAPPSIIKDKIYLYEVSNNQYNSAQLLLLSSVSVSTFSLPTGAFQLGSTCDLDYSAWSNITGGFYMNGIIHFCYHIDDGNGYSEILYNRLDVSTYAITTQIASTANTDYRFGSVASIGIDIYDKAVVVGFSKSANNIYPEIRFKYYDDAMTTVASTIVKTGDSYVCYTGSHERWGDYTTMQRRYNTSTYPVVWLVSSYGNFANKWSDYVAQIGYDDPTSIANNNYSDNISIVPNPSNGIFSFISTSLIKYDLLISNVLGEKIFEARISGSNNEIDLSNKPNGLYFVQLISEKGNVTKKLVINK